MKRLFNIFFVGLWILLLSGYNQLYAHEDQTACIAVKNTESSDHSIFSTVQNDHSFIIKSALSSKEKENDKIDPTEDEDDKLISFKKYLENNNYFITFFCPQTQGCFYHCIKKCLPVCKQFFYFSSCRRYIMFRVIRI